MRAHRGRKGSDMPSRDSDMGGNVSSHAERRRSARLQDRNSERDRQAEEDREALSGMHAKLSRLIRMLEGHFRFSAMFTFVKWVGTMRYCEYLPNIHLDVPMACGQTWASGQLEKRLFLLQCYSRCIYLLVWCCKRHVGQTSGCRSKTPGNFRGQSYPAVGASVTS